MTLCDSYQGVGPGVPRCSNVAEFAIGVEFVCCCDGETEPYRQTDYVCAWCLEHDDNRCVDCGEMTRFSEPVRLRAA